MAEHYNKNTISASLWCRKCGKFTEHRIDTGLRGPCMICLAKLATAQPEKKPPQKEKMLFD